MIRINNIKLPVNHSEADFINAIAKSLRIKAGDVPEFTLVRRSLDCRKKPDLYYVYTVEADIPFSYKIKSRNIAEVNKKEFVFQKTGTEHMNGRPVITGAGPAGLFCGLYLARAGFKPLIIERGKKVEERKADVDRFWEYGCLDEESNAVFGEGGAGTFSDGKLNTGIHDRSGMVRAFLKDFVSFGADESILYDAKPHIGTDGLIEILKNIRSEIERCGGEFRFNTRLDDIAKRFDGLTLIFNDGSKIDTDCAVLAIGNGARDTFSMLQRGGIRVEAKPLALGYRIEHPQDMIDIYSYGVSGGELNLPAAPYKLTAKTSSGRGVYSFCMCPGGYVVNSSSKAGFLCVNGMSYADRAGANANSAIVVTVSPDDIEGDSPLRLMQFQEDMEKKTFDLCNGKMPVQRLGDFRDNIASKTIEPLNAGTHKGAVCAANLRGIYPDYIENDILEGLKHFGHIIPGFDNDDAVLTAAETRTSSPVRIKRNDICVSENCDYLYPCGEGAGYAGGIVSSAVDGIRVAQEIACRFKGA